MTIEQVEQLKAQGKQRTAVALAACSLACHRRGYKERQSKVYTGYLEGRRRAYRGQRVVLPDGTLGFIFGIQRGKAAIWKDSPFTVGEREHLVADVSGIELYKLPSAVLMGRQKAGVVERASARKRLSCRMNGCRPCAPGKRRGRPRTSGLSMTPEAHQSLPPTAPMTGKPCVMDYQTAIAYYARPQAHSR